MKTILLLLALAAPCFGQRKVWTWTSPIANETSLAGALHDVATDDRGNAAFIIGELKATNYPNKEFCRYRLVWVSATGKVLLNVLVDRPDDQMQHILNADSARPWSVIAVSATKWAVTDSRTIWTATLKAGKATVKTTEVPEEEFVFPANNKSTFPGWFRQSGVRGSWSFGDGRPEATIALPLKLELWVP
jgi:hypothetical protein